MKPRLAITMGDPTGIGPETIAGAWGDVSLHGRCHAVVLGHPETMRRAAELVRCAARVVEVTDVDQLESSAGLLPCLKCCHDSIVDLRPACVDPRGGEAAFQAVTMACQLAQTRRVDALVTAPLNKAALVAAGHDYPGHTELLADLCRVEHVAMMLYLAHGPHILGRDRLGCRSRHVARCAARCVCPSDGRPDHSHCAPGPDCHARHVGLATSHHATEDRRLCAEPARRGTIVVWRRRGACDRAGNTAGSGRRHWICTVRCRPTHSWLARLPASSMPWLPCTTIKATSP